MYNKNLIMINILRIHKITVILIFPFLQYFTLRVFRKDYKLGSCKKLFFVEIMYLKSI